MTDRSFAYFPRRRIEIPDFFPPLHFIPSSWAETLEVLCLFFPFLSSGQSSLTRLPPKNWTHFVPSNLSALIPSVASRGGRRKARLLPSSFVLRLQSRVLPSTKSPFPAETAMAPGVPEREDDAVTAEGGGAGGSPTDGHDDAFIGPETLDDSSNAMPPDPPAPDYNPRRPINKGKLILLLTVIFVAVLVSAV